MTDALEPMTAMAGPLPPDGRYAFEPKWDGMRAIVVVGAGRMSIRSRNQLEQAHRFPELQGIAHALAGHDVVLDGEIVAFDGKGRPDFGRLQGRFGLVGPHDIERQARLNPAHFIAFDLLRLDGLDLTGLSYVERRNRLESLGFEGPSWATTPMSPHGKALLALSRRTGMEGVMAKRLDSAYLPGQRSPAWLKVRNRGRQEFVVGGWSEGEGSRRGSFGSLLVGYHGRPSRRALTGSASRSGGTEGRPPRPRSLVYAGRVGSGYRDDDLARLQRLLEGLASKRNPFRVLPQEKDVHFVQPTLVVEVEFNGLSRHGLLRQPSFKGIRADKPAGLVVWEQEEGRAGMKQALAGAG